MQVFGEDGTKESFGPFLGYPTKYLIDREGLVVKRYFGLVGEELADDVETLIEDGLPRDVRRGLDHSIQGRLSDETAGTSPINTVESLF